VQIQRQCSYREVAGGEQLALVLTGGIGAPFRERSFRSEQRLTRSAAALQQVVSSVLSLRGPEGVWYGSHGAHGALRHGSCAMVMMRCVDAASTHLICTIAQQSCRSGARAPLSC